MKVLACLCLTALAGCAPPQKAAAPQDAAIQSAIRSGQQNYEQKANSSPARPALAAGGGGTYSPTSTAQKKQMKVCRQAGTSQYLVIPTDTVCPSRP